MNEIKQINRKRYFMLSDDMCYGYNKTAENWEENAQVKGKWSFK